MIERSSGPLVAVATVLAWRPAGLAVHLVGIMILSRLLDPADFGVFAVAAAAFWLADAAVDFGVSSNLLRAEDRILAEDDLSAAFGLWIFTSLLAAVLFAAAASVATGLGGALGPTLGILALALPLGAPVLVAETRLRHGLNMRLLARLPVLTAISGVAVAALGGWLGLGAGALAAGLVAERVVQLGALMASRGTRLVRPRAGGWRTHLSFGSAYTATTLLPKLSVSLRLAVVNGVLGAGAVGLLNRAEAVARLNERVILEAVAPIVLPVMTHARRAGATLVSVYVQKVDLLAAVCWPAAIVAALLADPLVAVLLGRDWTQTVPLVRILAVSAIAFPFTRMSISVFALLKAERTALRIQAGQQAFAFVLVAGAALISLPAVCAATAGAHLVKAWRTSAALKRLLAYPAGTMRPVILRNAALAMAAGTGPAATLLLAPDLGAAATLAVGVPVAGAGWLAALAVLRHPLLPRLGEVLKMVAPAAQTPGRR